jgi:ribosomal protein S19E (S16A)
MTESRKVWGSAGNRGKGRKKGVPNKVTGALKDMILQALENKGGVAYLEKQADENPTAFVTLLGKVLPLQVNADVNSTVVGVVTFKGLNG